MNKPLKILLFGFLSWLVPFALAFLFYTPEGKLTIDIFLFKSIMAVTGSLVGAALLVKYFRDVKENFVNEGLKVGAALFAINIILDLVVLIPMSGMAPADYFAQIGLHYLVIPIMAVAIGMVAGK